MFFFTTLPLPNLLAMIIGIPRERKTLEQRVALTPKCVSTLTAAGHIVLVETGAGELSYFTDELYKSSGAKISSSLEEVWRTAELVVKVKEPHLEEYKFFRPGLIIFDYLHLAGLPEVASQLLQHKVTGIAYELVQTEDGRLPLLEPMSEVAGKLAVQNGAHCLLAQNGGRGVLLGGTTNVGPGNVVIAGAGIAGTAAASVAVGMGANVTVLDINQFALDRLSKMLGDKVNLELSSPESLIKHTSKADLVISAVLVPGAKAPMIFSRELIKKMLPGSVFVDISIDQGGSAETSRPTSLEEPTFMEEGVIHYAVPNMPAQTARTSTLALTNTTLPYIRRIADLGLKKALIQDLSLAKALNTWNGNLTNQAVSIAINKPYIELSKALEKMESQE